MDRIAEWRPVDPAGPDGSAESSADEEQSVPKAGARAVAPAARAMFMPALLVLSLTGITMAAGTALVVMSSLPSPAVAIDASNATRPTGPDASGALATIGSAAVDPPVIVVDVQGAVENPGAWRLAAGSRVGDAIAAAGGYSAQIDIAAASRQLNLAEPLMDGQQIHVPLRGEAEAATADPGDSGGASATPPVAGGATGLVNVNSATEDQLDALPGIGPVTAAKIISARQDAPFTSIDELLTRGVVGQSTLDKIRSLITVGS